jgi:thiamine-monophosphate kinase
MNEFELISKLTKSLPTNSFVVASAGDDCAVLDSGQPGRYLLFKTDAVVQGIHFEKDADPVRVGHKALARCLSDIAAMAGRPIAALVTIGLPKDFDAEYIRKIYDGVSAVAQKYGVAIVGGETTSNPERVLISISLLGDVASDKCVMRSGAKDGDALFVTGDLGGSLAEKHFQFEPRIKEAHWLTENFSVHAMIDLSDGLAGDLRHILNASKVGAEIRAASIPISRAAKLQAKTTTTNGKTPLIAALSDGEDFELLFTVASKDAVKVLDGWKKHFPQTRLTVIGRITSAPGLKIRDEHGVRELNIHGYAHFA